MSIDKCKDFINDGYGTWDDTSKPTTFANMHDYMKNQNNIVMNLAKGLWQPNTAYVVGDVVRSPSLPAGCKATCTTAGASGDAEPKWTAYGTTVTDGGVKWKMETDEQGTMDSERKKAIDDMHNTITGEMQTAINSLHDTIKTEMQTAMLALFPVGTILETTNDANPSTYIGGTWELLPGGYTTVSAGTYEETHNVNGTDVKDTYVFTAGKTTYTVNGTETSGEAKHQITEGELAKHTTKFDFLFFGNTGTQVANWGIVLTNNPSNTYKDFYPNPYSYTGNDEPHNNIAPLYGVYRFRRLT